MFTIIIVLINNSLFVPLFSEMENLIHLNENSLLNNCGTASSSENVQSFLRNFLSNYGQQVDLIDVNKQIAELEIISEYIDANM